MVPGITDKGYITNSYHVHVSEKIDAFTKLKFESEFQRLSPGGAISYVEVRRARAPYCQRIGAASESVPIRRSWRHSRAR